MGNLGFGVCCEKPEIPKEKKLRDYPEQTSKPQTRRNGYTITYKIEDVKTNSTKLFSSLTRGEQVGKGNVGRGR